MNSAEIRQERRSIDQTREPPSNVLSGLRFVGPGLILSAAIVGSGELIATTSLGARAGFMLLWVILFGCLVKVAVQLEYGRFAIVHGLPTYQAWNHVGKFRVGPVHWTVWAGVLYMISSLGGQAGVLGGAAQVGTYVLPAISVGASVGLVVLLIIGLQFQGRYGPVEIVATVLNVLFVGTIIYCVVAVQQTGYAFSSSDLLSGLSFQLPRETVPLAVAAFGIIGIASGEISTYPYWCLEKGYAAWTGPHDDSETWARRARGWIRVMMLDAVLSMAIYTLATAGFYVLGATVLRARPVLADGNEFIYQLSALFTDLLGEGTRGAFMLCAFTVLFSTIFANTAAFSRLWTDFFGLCGWLDWRRDSQRRRFVRIVTCVFPVVCGVIYLFVQRPLLLIVFLGITNALYLLVVAYQAIVFRYGYTDSRLRPGIFYDLALWASIVSIGFMAVHTGFSLFS
ncbi:MAG: Nramp family divalent metal transporter [Acidobacteriota bacterium]